jgi:LPPG:FO 2-phospho-L-lactate transferase
VNIVALAGGTGAAKLVRGIAQLVDPRELSVIVNTGDDAIVWGLHVSPDVDTICYALAGILDTARGWGLRDESFHTLAHMARFGEPTWFNLGDRDLATHLHRTRLLGEGRTLTEVTASIAVGLGARATVLPMSDEPVRTHILGPDGWLDFQEYFVRDKAQVEVQEVRYAGAEAARPAPGVIDAIGEADLVVLCPSNPITSSGPILSVPGIREALGSTSAVTIAVSPIVGADAVSGPAGRLMAASALPVSAAGVAQAYRPWLDVLVLDERDRAQAGDVEHHGVRPAFARIIMSSAEAEVLLALRVLAAARER